MARSINDCGEVAVAVRPESGDGRLAWIDRDGAVHDLGPAGGTVDDFDINNRRQAVWTVGTGASFSAFTCRLGR